MRILLFVLLCGFFATVDAIAESDLEAFQRRRKQDPGDRMAIVISLLDWRPLKMDSAERKASIAVRYMELGFAEGYRISIFLPPNFGQVNPDDGTVVAVLDTFQPHPKRALVSCRTVAKALPKKTVDGLLQLLAFEELDKITRADHSKPMIDGGESFFESVTKDRYCFITRAGGEIEHRLSLAAKAAMTLKRQIEEDGNTK